MIVDALDAARKPQTQSVLRNVIAGILRVAQPRWNVIASVRKYDLRQGTEWSRMFHGRPPLQGYGDPEFPNVRNVSVGRLTDAEIAQLAASYPSLQQLYSQASEKLRDLLRNIFNLHLLSELLMAGVAGAALTDIGTQPELLDRYWRYRIQREDGRHDAREIALTAIVSEMIDTQTLRVLRATVRTNVDTDALVDLERHGIIRAEDQGGRPNEDVLLFTHHILFDYAVSRLIFRRGRDASHLVQLLRARRELALMLSPSLSLALVDVWGLGASRLEFWELAFALNHESALPGVAQLAAPMVAADLAQDMGDFAVLEEALSGPEPRRAAAEAFMQNLMGAILVRMKSGVPLTGPTAGPWLALADRLTTIGSEKAMLAVRALIANVVEKL